MKNNAITLLAILIWACAPAVAQNTMFLRGSPISHLDPDDREKLRSAIEEVMESPDGTIIDWSNPDTGSRGRIKVLDTHEAFGTTCRNLRSRSEARGRQGEGIYRLCKADDGTWRFATTDIDVLDTKPAPEKTE